MKAMIYLSDHRMEIFSFFSMTQSNGFYQNAWHKPGGIPDKKRRHKDKAEFMGTWNGLACACE
jgi:hypothetical protein